MPNKVEDVWLSMPEYNNVNQNNPAVVVTFKFLTEEDYQLFYGLIKEHLYNGDTPFRGGQTKSKKSAWYPPTDRPSTIAYVNGE